MAQCKVARILASSVCLAAESGKLIRTIFNNGDLGIVDKGGIKNYQTEADRAVERLIISSIKAEFPTVTVLGEEGEDQSSESRFSKPGGKGDLLLTGENGIHSELW